MASPGRIHHHHDSLERNAPLQQRPEYLAAAAAAAAVGEGQFVAQGAFDFTAGGTTVSPHVVPATPVPQQQQQQQHEQHEHQMQARQQQQQQGRQYENLSAVAAAAAIVIGASEGTTDPNLAGYTAASTVPSVVQADSSIQSAAPAVASSAQQPNSNSGTVETLFCGRCHVHRPYADFFGPPHPETMKKNCVHCRTKMNLYKRSVERSRSHGREFADIPESHRVSSMAGLKELLTTDLFSVPVREQNDAAQDDSSTAAHAQFKYFVSPTTVFNDKTIGEWFEGTQGEPHEVYKFVIKAVMEITGYSFQRHGRYTYTRNTGGWSSRYKCGQATSSASRHVRKTGPKARNVVPRTYYKCDGVLTISGTVAGLRIVYDHLHIHTGRTRKPSVKKGDPIFPEDIPTNIKLLRNVAPMFVEQLQQSGAFPSLPPPGFTGFDHPQFAERRKLMMLFFGTGICKNNRPLQDFLMAQTEGLARTLSQIHDQPEDGSLFFDNQQQQPALLMAGRQRDPNELRHLQEAAHLARQADQVPASSTVDVGDSLVDGHHRVDAEARPVVHHDDDDDNDDPMAGIDTDLEGLDVVAHFNEFVP